MYSAVTTHTRAASNNGIAQYLSCGIHTMKTATVEKSR